MLFVIYMFITLNYAKIIMLYILLLNKLGYRYCNAMKLKYIFKLLNLRYIRYFNIMNIYVLII